MRQIGGNVTRMAMTSEAGMGQRGHKLQMVDGRVLVTVQCIKGGTKKMTCPTIGTSGAKGDSRTHCLR